MLCNSRNHEEAQLYFMLSAKKKKEEFNRMLDSGESNPYPWSMTMTSPLPICSISSDDSSSQISLLFFDIKYCI